MLLWCGNALRLGLNVTTEVLLQIAGDKLQILNRPAFADCNAALVGAFNLRDQTLAQLLRIEISLLLILRLGKLCVDRSFNLAQLTAVDPQHTLGQCRQP